ncbi:MAG: SDR family oxidoreductase [Deltaproteobacteria bacterium]|nr:SDR family oxidoreductase [Deltaproteobacteria bacterium]
MTAVAGPNELLKGRVAVITGAGRGIGRGVAECFVAQGARVVINDLEADAAAEALAACQAAAGAGVALAHAGSVADADYAAELMKATIETFGKIDILVNNAGLSRDAMLHNMSSESWRQVIDVNLGGTYNCCHAAAPYLRDVAKAELAERGEVAYHRKVINYSSTAAINGNIGQCNYAAAKMGNIGLTRALAREWAPFRINVNAVAPGFTETRMTQPKEDGDGKLGIPRAQRAAFIARLPFGRPASPADVANVVLFFASPLSDWVTGQEINVSGGHQIP